MRRKSDSMVNTERASEIIRMIFEGQIYDFCIDEHYFTIWVRYCDFKPLSVMRDILKQNLRGYDIFVDRVYSMEAISQELYRLCTDGGWVLIRNEKYADDNSMQNHVKILTSDKNVKFYP